MTSLMEPKEAKARLHAGGEVAFLDVREAGQFGEGHPLFAVPCPYSRLELIVTGLVPRRDTPVILIDNGDGVAGRAARRLADLAYTDVAIVAGGVPAWSDADLTLFKGVNVPSKTLGELVEAAWHPPTIGPETLRAWKQEGRDFRFFDARPAAEFFKMHVPGAACLPNGELAHRFAAAVPDPDMPVLISCAGRTRGIVGALGLKLAGVPNPVYALENGTQGWAMAGETLERGDQAAPYPPLDAESSAASRRRAQILCARENIPEVDFEACEKFNEDFRRTTYLFDVRSAEEYRAGTLPGAVHAPSGQLVQATDQWIGTRGARVVLADDTGLRAALAAFWLRQLGWETYVLAGTEMTGRPVETHRPQGSRFAGISAEAAAAGLHAGTHAVLDLRPSNAYHAGHPAGAIWAIRPRLAGLQLGSGTEIVLVADDPSTAEISAVDLREMGCASIRLLEGGHAGWQAASLPVEASPDQPSPADAIDVLLFVHDRHDGNLDASRRYLAWEQGLVGQLDPLERAEFRVAAATP